MQKYSSHSYVDDAKLIIPFQLKDKVYAVTNLNNDLIQIANWYSNNYLLAFRYTNRSYLQKCPTKGGEIWNLSCWNNWSFADFLHCW